MSYVKTLRRVFGSIRHVPCLIQNDPKSLKRFVDIVHKISKCICGHFKETIAKTINNWVIFSPKLAMYEND